MSEHFDPSQNVDLDATRGLHNATFGNQLLERVGLRNRVFFDEASNWFYMPDSSGEWKGRKESTFSNYLKRVGVNAVRDDKSKMSDLDLLLTHVSLDCSVVYAGPIAGFRRGLILNNGHRMLCTREAEIIKPIKGEFPTVWKLLNQMFGEGTEDLKNDGDDQLPYILGWWKHSLECLAGKYGDQRGLCMVFAGAAGCGKSLLKTLISETLGGRECKPYRYMTGNENFCGEFLGSELWVIDDEQASTRARDRSEFGANIKMAVADEKYRIRGMMKGGVVLKMYRRLLVCVNREPERLQVLPSLDADIQDKISVLLAHNHPMPMPVGSPEEKDVFKKTLSEELPAFVWWLLNEHEISPDLFGRFGIIHYHHPDLCSDLFEVSRDREFWLQVLRVLKASVFSCDDFCGATWYWCGAANELYELMANEENTPLSRNEVSKLPWSNSIGKALAKISKQMPDRCLQKKICGIKKWFITMEGRTALDAVEIERGLARGKDRASTGQGA